MQRSVHLKKGDNALRHHTFLSLMGQGGRCFGPFGLMTPLSKRIIKSFVDTYCLQFLDSTLRNTSTQTQLNKSRHTPARHVRALRAPHLTKDNLHFVNVHVIVQLTTSTTQLL